MIALTRLPCPHMARCLRAHAAGPEVDYHAALAQHAGYRAMLARCGADVRVIDADPAQPDCVFIEDTAVVLDEVAILCSMGHPARRGEPAGVEPVLRQYRKVVRIEPPATIDGGDVQVVGRRILVGLSRRTNDLAARALQAVAAPHGYQVITVPVTGCLHLKSALTALPDGRLLANLDWVDPAPLSAFEVVSVPAEEPDAANVAVVGQTVCAAAGHPQTAELLRRLGFRLQTTDLSEFAKADGCVTCLSLLLC